MDTIPPITDSLGSHWNQPKTNRILLDDKNALMDLETFKQLAEYSLSNPSGVYVGKMWKRHCNGQWWLCWYGESLNPGFCSNNYREILVV
jgi:hypothetical protein